MLSAVIFDFDGVITDSEILHFNSFNEVLSQYEIKLTKEDYFREYLGLTDIDLLKLLVDKGTLDVSKDEIGKLVEEKTQVFQTAVRSQAPIIAGVPEFLEILKDNNIPSAICSGAILADIEVILKATRLQNFFQTIVSADDVQKGKPDPQGFLLALEKLNVNRPEAIEAGNCIVIEDSRWGLEAAAAAGMHTIAVTNSYDANELSLAEKIVTHLDELSIEDLRKLCAQRTG